MEILVQMTEAKGSIDTAAELLKENEIREIETDNSIEDYGYSLNGKNYYRGIYQRNVLIILIGSSILYVLFLLLLFLNNNRKRREQKEIFLELEEIVDTFRKGRQYEAEIILQGEAANVLMELEALGDTIALWKEESEREREGVKSLVTDISHQLKTPVAALKTCIEILQQNHLQPKEQEEFLKRCDQQLKGLENLFSALLQISRMEAGMIEIKKEDSDIFQTLIEAVNRVHVKADEKQIEIEMEAEEELQNLKLAHDKKWMGEALINLLENAIKYSPEGKHIFIRMAKRVTFLRIEIEDEGIGIAKKEYHLIFKRFYRGHTKEVKQEEGSGVGLYLTREIVSRHGGTVTVHSKERTQEKGICNGSVFVVQLPYQ
ncbi:MAG: HAMP domain-containing histidine kinase [Lachnospiraceae bacterium]|nr:HAMP domain-containing histidine kinase [Lachnospiraceae bacterium]